MEPVKINKCKTDFTVNSQTGPALRNSKKWFGKQIKLVQERRGSPDASLVEVKKKDIRNFDEIKSKPVLRDELIRGVLAVGNKNSGKNKSLNKSSSKQRTGYLNRKSKDSQH